MHTVPRPKARLAAPVRIGARAAILITLLAALPATIAFETSPGPAVHIAAGGVQRTVERASRSADRVALGGHVVTLTDGGQTRTLRTNAATVRDALVEAGVTRGPDDMITPDLTTALGAATTVVVTRVTATVASASTEQPFTTRTETDPRSPVGTQKVVQVGQVGRTEQVLTVYTDQAGTELRRKVTLEVITAVPVEEVISTGTKVVPVPAAAAASTSAPAAAAVQPGTAREIGLEQTLARGWDTAQFACLDSLWQKESGWRVSAGNPSSDAFGIPQSLPGKKMASAGADWATNPATQITWGLGYIAGRYTTPCGAWDHSVARGWY